MKELISINIGQAGIQMANLCWEYYCIEHGISLNGFKEGDSTILSEDNTMFSEVKENYFIPRSISFDSDPETINSVKNTKLNKLFTPDQLISAKQNSKGCFSAGYLSIGKEYIDLVVDQIRKESEKCSNLEGFILLYALGGGTGSGFSSRLSERLSIDYGKKIKSGFTLYPSPKLSTSLVEPYNFILSATSLIEHLDLNFIIDNEALYDICRQKLEIGKPRYEDMNHIVASTLANLTSSIRLNGEINCNLRQMSTNLVPYPRIHFLFTSSAPMYPYYKTNLHQPLVSQITLDSFNSNNLLAKAEQKNKYIAISMLYRGDVLPLEARNCVSMIKDLKLIKFEYWVPTGLTFGVNMQPPLIDNTVFGKSIRSLITITNSMAVGSIVSRINHKFDQIFSKRAFVHFFVREGTQEDDFMESREDFAALEKDYEEPHMCDEEEEEEDFSQS